jgi:HD-GYP domain-containing protein (c-di-GMP phosphodiesterase class II)
LAIANLKLPQLSVTASFGVSSRSLLAGNPQELLDQADKCLYVAKQNGRNCVVRFDRVPSEVLADQFKPSHTRVAPTKTSAKLPTPNVVNQPIPFHAVIALMSALSYRDLTTAEHSRRVADLCVRIGEGLMSPSQCYLLEIAALLHDIGKIGVPDSILLKSGPLTPDEREMMRTHQHNGVALVRTSFKSPELCAILECRALPPNATYVDPQTGETTRIPVGARILAIADSFDAMVSHRAYRTALTHAEAFAELRRCAGSQFDAELVERFVNRSLDKALPTSEATTASKETALSIGMHVEHLVSALDRQDFESLKDLASHMQLVATKQGANEIALQAADLQSTLNADETDLLAILHEAESLLKLCRETQQAYIDDIRPTATLGHHVGHAIER